MLRLPLFDRRWRLLALIYGVIVFLWLTPEEDSVETVTLLGAGAAALIVFLQMLRRFGGREIPARYVLPGAALTGALIGLVTGITTAGLMLIKNALHSHLFPDYPPDLMLALLARVPTWALAGALAGFGLSLAWLALRQGSAHDERQRPQE